jgi:hypothetical protein
MMPDPHQHMATKMMVAVNAATMVHAIILGAKGVLGARERAVTHFAAVVGHRLEGLGSQIRKTFDELARRAFSEAEHIVADKNLAITVGPGANADGRNLNVVCDVLGEFCGDALQNNCTGPGVF